MVSALRRRGPDDQGVWEDVTASAALGHARLSIIDLSAAGHQPMVSTDGRYVIVFNGEIYNYKELRVLLERKGHAFRSHCDTEVILVSFAEWGRDAIRRLRGMFAFAILDRVTSRLLLARDRLGIKPLVYAEAQESFVFASELRALLASGVVPKRVDADAVLDYLAVGAVFQPRTILASVKALPPGCWMEVQGTGGELRGTGICTRQPPSDARPCGQFRMRMPFRSFARPSSMRLAAVWSPMCPSGRS
jgi:asparagine synthase (glutamine-hydrolysing)